MPNDQVSNVFLTFGVSLEIRHWKLEILSCCLDFNLLPLLRFIIYLPLLFYLFEYLLYFINTLYRRKYYRKWHLTVHLHLNAKRYHAKRPEKAKCFEGHGCLIQPANPLYRINN